MILENPELKQAILKNLKTARNSWTETNKKRLVKLNDKNS